MATPETLEVISLPEQASRLTKPFTMIDLAQIDDLVLSVYLCQGTMPQHRHLDQDELFLVYSGTISLDSDWGSVILRPGELTVAPKGLGHRSSSMLRSLVLLLQPRLLVNRRNGDRKLFALKEQGRLEKVSVPAVGRQIAVAHRPITLAHLDTFAFAVTRCQDSGPWTYSEAQSHLVFCFQGVLTLESEGKTYRLGEGELVVIPPAVAFRQSSESGALVLGVWRHREPGMPD